MPRETHRAGGAAAPACGRRGAACARASRGRGGWCTVKEGRETLCGRGPSLTDRQVLAGGREAAEAGARSAGLAGPGARLCISAGSGLAASSAGGGGKATLGGGGGGGGACGAAGGPAGGRPRCWGGGSGGGGGGGRVSAAACSGPRPSAALPHTAPLPARAPNGCAEAGGAAWLKTPADRRQKGGFNEARGGGRAGAGGAAPRWGAGTKRQAAGRRRRRLTCAGKAPPLRAHLPACTQPGAAAAARTSPGRNAAARAHGRWHQGSRPGHGHAHGPHTAPRAA